MSAEIRYGVINEDELSLRSPRAIEGDEIETIDKAFERAGEMIIEDGVREVAIVRAVYDERAGGWYEDPRFGCITIDTASMEDGFMGDES